MEEGQVFFQISDPGEATIAWSYMHLLATVRRFCGLNKMCYANQKGKCGDLIGIKGEVKEIALIKTYYMCL